MAEQRLPAVNSDDGEWGDILNQFIEKEHYNNGSDDVANGGHKNVTIRPGGSSSGSAPLKFTSGTLMDSPEPGAVEFQDDKLYFTKTTNSTRMVFAMGDTNITVGNTAPSSPSIGDIWIDTN